MGMCIGRAAPGGDRAGARSEHLSGLECALGEPPSGGTAQGPEASIFLHWNVHWASRPRVANQSVQ
eukprot:3116530-Pyramimonas_sp.AAC.1